MSLAKVQCDFFEAIGNCSLEGSTAPYYINVRVAIGNFAIKSLKIKTKVKIIEPTERNEFLLIDKNIDYCMFLSKQVHNPILNVISRRLEGVVPTECPIEEV